MYSLENYLNEDLLNEDLLEGLDESFDEARRGGRIGRINPQVRPQVTQQSNFGKSLSGNSQDYATKSDLKKALDVISNDVNELKKTSISTNKTLVVLDTKHTELAKISAQKIENQTKVLKNMQMMSMMSSLLIQPKLNVDNLEITQAVYSDASKTTLVSPEKISIKSGKNPIEIDQTMSLLLPMMTTMGDSGSGKSSDNSSMMLPLVLIMSQQNKDNLGTNNMLPLVMMMTMMNK